MLEEELLNLEGDLQSVSKCPCGCFSIAYIYYFDIIFRVTVFFFHNFNKFPFQFKRILFDISHFLIPLHNSFVFISDTFILILYLDNFTKFYIYR